jgi:hypothetical protein
VKGRKSCKSEIYPFLYFLREGDRGRVKKPEG